MDDVFRSFTLFEGGTVNVSNSRENGHVTIELTGGVSASFKASLRNALSAAGAGEVAEVSNNIIVRGLTSEAVCKAVERSITPTKLSQADSGKEFGRVFDGVLSQPTGWKPGR